MIVESDSSAGRNWNKEAGHAMCLIDSLKAKIHHLSSSDYEQKLRLFYLECIETIAKKIETETSFLVLFGEIITARQLVIAELGGVEVFSRAKKNAELTEETLLSRVIFQFLGPHTLAGISHPVTGITLIKHEPYSVDYALSSLILDGFDKLGSTVVHERVHREQSRQKNRNRFFLRIKQFFLGVSTAVLPAGFFAMLSGVFPNPNN